jgi:hypothetical protein
MCRRLLTPAALARCSLGDGYFGPVKPSPSYVAVVLLLGAIGLAACGKSSEQMAREQVARQAAMQKALADRSAFCNSEKPAANAAKQSHQEMPKK